MRLLKNNNMPEQTTGSTYTQKEIMEFHFKRFDEKLDDIKLALNAQNVNSERRFVTLETKVSDIEDDIVVNKTFQAKVITLGGLITLFGSTILAFTLNKLF